MIKILTIQGSPRGKAGNTEVILNEFLKGAVSQGASAETIYLKEKEINQCTGCFTCWTKTPGVCVFKDDMPALLEKIRACDISVFATPLYIYSVTAMLQKFQERLLPLLDPHLIKAGEGHRHPNRYETHRKMVLLSNCGFPEIKHFDALRRKFRLIEENGAVPLVGELLVPAGELLGQDSLKGLWGNVFAALFRAGVEVVRDGSVSRETEEIVQKTIFAPDEIAEMANIMWDGEIAGVSHGIQKKINKMDNIKLLLRGMALLFNPGAVPDLSAVIQFEVTGKQSGNWYLSIANGKCVFTEGISTNPNLTIKTPSEIWLSISNKEIDAKQALIEEKYEVEGDMNLLMSMKDLFSRG